MAALSSALRSYVHLVKDWPRGTYRRKWGYLHDQVWFPCGYTEAEMTDLPVMDRDGKFYTLYLDRRMIWTPWFHIRLHTFYQGDEDAAPHDHPWWFITIPFSTYYETEEYKVGPYWLRRINKVRAFLPHFRRLGYRHFVHEPKRPFSTIILTGKLKKNWGFWPQPEKFVPHREWSTYNRG